MDEGTKGSDKDSPKITLKIVRSPKKGAKRKYRKSVDGDVKLKKRLRKEANEEEYVPSDSGSVSEKGAEVTAVRHKKLLLFKGVRTEKVVKSFTHTLETKSKRIARVLIYFLPGLSYLSGRTRKREDHQV